MNVTRSRSRQHGARHRRLLPLLAALAIMGAAHSTPVAATDTARTVSIGESNTEAQRAEVLDYLGADDTDQVVTISVGDTLQTMDGVFDLSGVDSAYSSTALACDSEGSGIDVMTRNIEVIPPELYALALLTAGMTDVQLSVAAPSDAPALGMTALTGVFKTWDMAECSDSTSGTGSDPVRRQLALEELALIAEIGQEPEAVRQTTLVVLEAQREILGGEVTTDELGEIVASRSEEAGLDLSDEDQAEIVDFLDRLSGADIEWGLFTEGWSTEYAEDGSGVVLTANEKVLAPARGRVATVEAEVSDRDVQAGVGGRTGQIEVSRAPDVTETPEATPPSLLDLIAMSTPAADDDSSTGIMGTVSERGRDELARWWPLAVGLGALLLLGIGARRHPSEKATTWFVSRGRMFWLGRTVRRPAIVQSTGRTRRVRVNRQSTQN